MAETKEQFDYAAMMRDMANAQAKSIETLAKERHERLRLEWMQEQVALTDAEALLKGCGL